MEFWSFDSASAGNILSVLHLLPIKRYRGIGRILTHESFYCSLLSESGLRQTFSANVWEEPAGLSSFSSFSKKQSSVNRVCCCGCHDGSRGRDCQDWFASCSLSLNLQVLMYWLFACLCLFDPTQFNYHFYKSEVGAESYSETCPYLKTMKQSNELN